MALAGLDAEIDTGITGLLGSNDAGKTTFLSLMLGLRSRDEGDLWVLGEDPAAAGIDVRARIGYAPEHHDLPAELTAAGLVRHLAELHLLPPRAAVQRANDALWPRLPVVEACAALAAPRGSRARDRHARRA